MMRPPPAPTMSRRGIQLRSLAIMAGALLLVSGLMGWQLYRLALRQAESELRQIARAQATLIDAIGRFDAVHAGASGGSRARTLSQVRAGSTRYREFGRTGEIILAESRDGSVHFLLPERSIGYRIPPPVQLGADTAGPTQRAVRGGSGIIRARDFRGVEVLAAYEFLPFLELGLVAKKDIAEVRAPFVRLGLAIAGLALLVLAVAMRLHERVVGPALDVVFHRTTTLESGLRAVGAESERYATVFRSAADPIIITDTEGRVLEANRAALETYGWTADELVGRPMRQLLPPEAHSQADALLLRCLRGEEVRDVETTRLTRDGTVRHVLVTLSPLRDEGGTVIAVSDVAKDITDLRHSQERLEEYSRSLEEKVAERTKALEHELRVARTLAAQTRRGSEIVLLGDSIAVRALREEVDRHADELQPLLLGGPAGAGQEAVARAIHEHSPRADRPFIAIDCSRPIGEDSTPLLGLQRGAAKVAVAEGGTLFLDPIDQLPMELQAEFAELLRTAGEERAAGRVPVPDMRVIAYATPDAFGTVNAARLHPALAAVLGRNRLSVPSLAERRQDVEPLAMRMLADRARTLGKPVTGFTDRARERFAEYDWPGNLRELQGVVERILLVTTGTLADLEDDLRRNVRTIGGYRLVDRIGQGGMGEVWLGEHALLKRPAAVKLIQRGGELRADEREMLERRFQREASVTAQLRSSHTVELYDFGVTPEGQFFYVMEFLEGLSLGALIDIAGPLPPARAIHLVRQACLSLGEAHAAGLVHRDIKPENLFVSRMATEADLVKVLDFGIVKQERSRDGTGDTKTGMLVGTPAYLSPEVASGGEATAASDLYALGCVLYRALTGRLVFEAENMMEAILAHIERTPEPPSAHAPHRIPPALDALVQRCLAKSPDARPASAMELRRLLGEIPLEEGWDEAQAMAWWQARERTQAPALSQQLSTILLRGR